MVIEVAERTARPFGPIPERTRPEAGLPFTPAKSRTFVADPVPMPAPGTEL